MKNIGCVSVCEVRAAIHKSIRSIPRSEVMLLFPHIIRLIYLI